MNHAERIGAARTSLEGLATGDAFGERFFGPDGLMRERIAKRKVPDPLGHFTDDTVMAAAIVKVLDEDEEIDQDHLATLFARSFASDPIPRGYGSGADTILRAIGRGIPWAEAARLPFGPEGSKGNGGGMRAAPIGGFFSDDLPRCIEAARRSAEVTHLHPEGRAGAIAVAVAALYAARRRAGTDRSLPPDMLAWVAEQVPPGPTKSGLVRASETGFTTPPQEVAGLLGSGYRVMSEDTVPFALWCAARHLDDFEACMWATVSGLGDRDTTCAIAGGVVALSVGLDGIPSAWRTAREPLPR